MRFIFTCGGTAGHIYPALAVANKLREILPSCDILFIGANKMMEMEIVPYEGYPIKGVNITNLSRSLSLNGIKHNIKTFYNVIDSTFEAKKIIRDFSPDCVIGTGGYVCYPVISAAHSLNIPTCIHESNAVPGLTTKLLEKKVGVIFSSLNSNEFSKNSKVEVVGTPVRESFDNLDCVIDEFTEDKPIVLSFMGSLGSQYMNEIIFQILEKHDEDLPFNLIHVTGSRYYDTFNRVSGKNYKIFSYLNNIEKYMIASDLVICRAGASTLSEISYLGKSALLIPSPNVTNNHQEKNARYFENNNAAKVLLENEFTADSFYDSLVKILCDSSLLKTLGVNARKLAVLDSSKRISNEIIELVKSRNIV